MNRDPFDISGNFRYYQNMSYIIEDDSIHDYVQDVFNPNSLGDDIQQGRVPNILQPLTPFQDHQVLSAESINQAITNIPNLDALLFNNQPQFSALEVNKSIHNLVIEHERDDESTDPVVTVVKSRLHHAMKTSEGSTLKATHATVPEEHVLMSKLVQAAYENHEKGHDAAVQYLEEQGLSQYKIDKDVADNAPRKRGILITSPDGERLLIMRGTSVEHDKADVVADAKIVAMTDKGAKHQVEAQQTYELARSKGGAIDKMASHSLGGNLTLDLANRHATAEHPIENVMINGAISLPQSRSVKNPNATHISVSTTDDPVSVLAQSARQNGAIDSTIVVETEAPRNIKDAIIGTHMLSQFEHSKPRNTNLTTVQSAALKISRAASIRNAGSFAIGFAAAGAVDRVADFADLTDEEREALQATVGGGLSAGFSGAPRTSRIKARATNFLRGAGGVLVGDAVGNQVTQSMLDSGASQLDAESVGIASNIFTGEATSIATEAGVLAIEGGLEAGMEGAILAGGAALAPETLGLSLVVAGVTAAAFIAINAFEHNDPQIAPLDYDRDRTQERQPTEYDRYIARQNFEEYETEMNRDLQMHTRPEVQDYQNRMYKKLNREQQEREIFTQLHSMDMIKDTDPDLYRDHLADVYSRYDIQPGEYGRPQEHLEQMSDYERQRMEIELHRYDYLRDANSALYQHNIERIFEKYGQPQPQQPQSYLDSSISREEVLRQADIIADAQPGQEIPDEILPPEQIMVA